MANDDRTDPGTPLQASVGEQLTEKAHREETTADEQRDAEQAHARVERKKGGEREAVAQQLEAAGAASPEGWRRRRERARELGRNRAGARTLVDSVLPFAAGAAVFFGLVGRGTRMRRILLAAGLPIVWRTLAAWSRRRAAAPA